MKKIVLIAIVSFVGIASQAQVKFGVKAGANVSNFNGSDADNAKSKFGFNAGGLVNIPISEMFSVQPEATFSLEGAKYDGGTDDVNFNLSFINIPVLFQYNNPSGFYAETGPQIGFLMSAKAKSGSASEDYKEYFKSTNFSWAVGAGFKTKSGFGFGARYNVGLSNIADDSESDLKQSNIAFGFFYLFGGDKK